MPTSNYDSDLYKQDFPDVGSFNWKTVKLITPGDVYYNNHRINGVILHDGNFMVNGLMFYKGEFEVINEQPFKMFE